MNFRALLQELRNEDVLTHVMFELTYACELDCFFCYNDRQKRGRRMSVLDHKRVLDELAAMQTLFVTYTGGEPTAHKQFFEIASAAKERGFVVRLKSHGHRIDDDMAKRLRDEVDPSRIDMSLHGACATTHERQTRTPGSFESVKRALGALRKQEIPVRLNATLTRYNQNEIEAMYALADSFQVPLFFDPHVTARDDGDQSPLEVRASPDGYRRLVEAKKRRAAKSEATPKVSEDVGQSEGPRKRHCGAGASSAHVDPFGNISPCVQWKVPLGNIHDDGFSKVWQSSAVQEVRAENEKAAHYVHEQKRVAYCPGAAHSERGETDKSYRASDLLKVLS